MKKNQRLKSLFTILLIPLLFLGASSFKQEEGCAPSGSDCPTYCVSSTQYHCLLTMMGGPCNGQTYLCEYQQKK